MIQSSNTFLGVKMNLQGIDIEEDFIVLGGSRSNFQMVLGYKWLSKLGETNT